MLRSHRSIAALGVALLAVAVLAPVIGADFITFDDHLYVTENQHVRAGVTIAGLRWALTTFESGNWHPLTWLSHMVDVDLFGLDPRGHHLTSLVLHAVNALLLFLALSNLTAAPGRSLAVAAMWAVHPLRVESVAWVAERKDLLSAFFGLAALGLYAVWVRKGRRSRLRLATAALALSLACKPMLVTLPLLLLLLDFWPLHRATTWAGVKPLLTEKLPMFLLAAIGTAVALMAQLHVGAVAKIAVVPLSMRFANAAVAVWRYVAAVLAPVALSPFYPLVAWHTAEVWAAAGGLVAATLGAVVCHRRRPSCLVGWLWFVLLLGPVLGVVQIGRQAMADRYTYMPSIGLLIALIWGAADLLALFPQRARRGLALLVGGSACAVLATLTTGQAGVWRDSVTLMTRAVSLAPTSSDAWRLLGSAYLDRGQRGLGLAALQHAVALEPDDPVSRLVLGTSLEEEHRPDQALAQYLEVLRRWPGHSAASFSAARVLAMHPDPRHRDGARALALLDAPRKNGWPAAEILTVEAAALAAMGRFDDAVATAERARALALPPLLEAVERGLACYRRHQPLSAEAISGFPADPVSSSAQRPSGFASNRLFEAPESCS